MKQSLKKCMAILIVLCLLFGMTMLTACGGTGNNNSANDNGIMQPTPPNDNNNANKPTGPYSYQPHLSATLPEIRINTLDGNNTFATERKDIFTADGFKKQEFPYQKATVSITNCDATDTKTDVGAQVKVRGNTTTIYDKKPFRIKFDSKQSMLGLNNNFKSKDWVLLADWRDPSLLRNNVGLYLGQLFYKEIGLYASDFRTVEVYLNNEYWGIYLLVEQNEVASERVNINKPEANYTGTDIGYLLEFDCYAEFEPESFIISYNNRAPLPPYGRPNANIMNYALNEYTIKSKIYSKEQHDFIAKYLDNLYTICYRAIVQNEYYEFNANKTEIVKSEKIHDAVSAVGNVVDLDSAVAVYILQEVVCDLDIANSSFYMSIDLSPTGDGKLRFQAPWDFDVSFGMRKTDNYGNLISPIDIYAAKSNNPWLVLFYKLHWIQEHIKIKWQDAKAHQVQEKLVQYIDDCARMYKDAYKKNFDKWQNIGANIKVQYDKNKNNDNRNDTAMWDDLYIGIDPKASWKCETQEEAATFLKDWLRVRFAYLNSIWC